MGFKLTFDDSNVSTGFELVKEGKYEVTILQAELKQIGDNWAINYDVEIRSDFKQDHQGAKILYNTLWLTSSNSEYAESTEKKRNSFLAACGYTGKRELDMEQVTKEIIGKNVYAYVKHRENNEGKTFPHVTFVAKTKLEGGSGSVANEDPFANNNKGPIEVSEDDLPF